MGGEEGCAAATGGVAGLGGAGAEGRWACEMLGWRAVVGGRQAVKGGIQGEKESSSVFIYSKFKVYTVYILVLPELSQILIECLIM